MKLISFNTWGGRAGKKKLLDFFKRHEDIDVFCLQEIWNGGHDQVSKWQISELYKPIPSLLTDIGGILSEHTAFFRPHWRDWYGLAIFVSKNIKIREEGDIFVFKDKSHVFDKEVIKHPRNLQYLTIETEMGLRTIANFHGLWTGGEKEDNNERFLQSDNIIKFLKQISHPHILCGDFNLLPKTQSLKKFEDFGMRNLIKEFNITSTRSSYYKESVRFADYTFISADVKVNEFKILPDEVSDHLAMYLDFE